MKCPTILELVPDIPGNKAAGEVEKPTANITHPSPKTPFDLIQRVISDPPLNRPRTAMMYENLSWSADYEATGMMPFS